MHICQPLCARSEAVDLVNQQISARFAVRIDRGARCTHVCINILTYWVRWVIGLSMTTPAKREALLASGTLNPHPAAVRSVLFHMDFFDPYDFAQVKYEMLVIECLATHIFINPLHGIVARDECASPALSATSEVLRCWG